MADTQVTSTTDVEAARLIADWKSLFARELRIAARALAAGSDVVTPQHCRQALPIATSRLLQIICSHSPGSANAERQVA